MRRRIALITMAALIALAGLALAGCGAIAEKATEAAVENATGVKVDKDSGTLTVTDKDGQTAQLTASGGAYPEGFPADFPQYANATIDSGLKGSKGGKDNFTVILKTQDSAKDVFDFYAKELEAAGWKIENKMDGSTNDQAFASINSVKDTMTGHVTITHDKDKNETAVLITVMPKQ